MFLFVLGFFAWFCFVLLAFNLLIWNFGREDDNGQGVGRLISVIWLEMKLSDDLHSSARFILGKDLQIVNDLMVPNFNIKLLQRRPSKTLVRD